MLTYARSHAEQNGLPNGRVRWMRADASSLPFKDSSVDAFTAHSFLYLVPKRDQVLAQMLRTLKPGGQVVLMEPNAHPVRLRDVWQISRDPRFLLSIALWRPASRMSGRFTASELHSTLEGAGLVNCSVQETLGGLGLLAYAEKALFS
jgi:ubiquinone/menaquinone biosynthesis C-methylase UbiE